MFVKKATKYWKEVSGSTTITPKYKCYRLSESEGYRYYNVLDGQVYVSNVGSTYPPTTNESNLVLDILITSIVSITEETLTVTSMMAVYPFDLYRSTAHDFGSYTTTGTTVIAGTPDDYTYKEEGLKTYAISKQGIVHKQGDFKRDFNVMGSPTITNDGVVSGFSTSNYLVLPENFDVTGGKTWQMFYKIRTGSDVTSIQSVTGTNYYRYDPVAILVESSKFELDICSGTGTTLFNKAGTYTVLPNTDYWIKVSFDGAKYTLDYSLDGVNYVNDISYSSTTSVYSQPLTIGIQCASSNGSFSSPFLGSIDLSESYIKINGEYFWSGFYTEDVTGDKRYIPITKRWGKLDFQFVYATAGTYTVEIPYDGEYELTVVGGGAGGAFVYSAKFWDGAAAGGSGGGFIGVTHLTKGTYTVTVGAGGGGNFNNNSATSCTAGYGGDSKFGGIVTAGGATAPTARYDAQSQTGSIGGTVRYDVSDFSSVSLASNGNTGYGSNQADGGTYAGGASVYEGYGAGGQAAHGACKAGTAGYVKIKAVNVYGYKETYY